MKKPHERELVVSTYTPTDAFRAIPHMEAVAFRDNLGLVATTGPMGDEESKAYARLFAGAGPLGLALLAVAEVAPGSFEGSDWCWCGAGRRKRIGRGPDPLDHAPYCKDARAALEMAGVLP